MGGIHEGHRARMKKRLLESGEMGFADHELLEMLLYYAIPRRDTNELAHRLLKQFGSLQGVLSASEEELACVKGMGQQAALLVALVPTLCRREHEGAHPQLRGQLRRVFYGAAVRQQEGNALAGMPGR